MENSNLNQPSAKACGTNIWGGVIILAAGILIGVLGTKYVWHGSASTSAADTASGGIAALTAMPASANAATPAADRSEEWNPLDQMRKMQAEIDQVFQRSFDDLSLNPKLKIFQKEPGYSLSMDVRDLKDRYQVRAFLPDTKASDVKVNLNGNQLKVDVTNKVAEKEIAKNSQSDTEEWGHYEEVVQLAGPLKQGQMQIQRQPHELLITVPKGA
jgi:HSP20 family molecular chaperone IbpA